MQIKRKIENKIYFVSQKDVGRASLVLAANRKGRVSCGLPFLGTYLVPPKTEIIGNLILEALYLRLNL